MTHFLDNLVRIALNRAPANAAHISLPSRFAEPSAAAAFPPDFNRAAAETADGIDAIRHAPLSSDASNPPQRPTLDSDQSQRSDRPLLVRVADADQPEASPSPLHANARQGQTVHPAPSDAYRANRDPPQPAPLRAPRATQVTDRPSAAAVADAAARTLSAPISDTAMAGRISARNQESPIVHVTIDRLEVRSAPSPKPAVEQRRERPQPAVSLSDYLRGNGSGRQG